MRLHKGQAHIIPIEIDDFDFLTFIVTKVYVIDIIGDTYVDPTDPDFKSGPQFALHVLPGILFTCWCKDHIL